MSTTKRKGRLVEVDFRGASPKAKAVRMLRGTLGEIERGLIKPTDMILLIREEDAEGLRSGDCIYRFKDNGMTKAQRLWMLQIAQRDLFDR